MQGDIKDLSRRLAERAPDIVMRLLPNGKKVGHEWQAGSIHGEAGHSLKVVIEGSKKGKWADFSPGSDHKGDLVDLWHLTGSNQTIKQTLDEIREFLGIERPKLEKARDKRKSYAKPVKPEDVRPAEEVILDWFRDRAITPATVELFGIATADAYVGDDPGAQPFRGPWILFPYLKPTDGKLALTNMKWRHIKLNPKSGKKVLIQAKGCEPCLFGWQSFDWTTARTVIICEGEPDAMTWRQLGWNALSVNAGGGTGDKQQWIEGEWDNLEQMEMIYISMDMDDEGKAAANDIARRLGMHRCRIVELPWKDANDGLMAGALLSEFEKALASAKEISPEALRSAGTFRDQVKDEFYPRDSQSAGLSTGIDIIDNHFRIRPGETTIVNGVNGHGKSLMVGQIVLHPMDESNHVCIFSGEMPAAQTIKRMVPQLLGEAKPTEVSLDYCMDWLDERLWVYNKIGNANWREMIEDFRYARRRYNCVIFIIDSLLKCGIADEDHEQQKEFVNAVVAFGMEEGAHTFIVTHSRKGRDEEEFRGKMDVKGSGAITDLAWNVVTVFRNKKKERRLSTLNKKPYTDDIGADIAKLNAQPDAYFILDKQRVDGTKEDSIWLWFDRATNTYTSSRDAEPRKFRTLGTGKRYDPGPVDGF